MGTLFLILFLFIGLLAVSGFLIQSYQKKKSKHSSEKSVVINLDKNISDGTSVVYKDETTTITITKTRLKN